VTARLESALAELADAIRAELRAELAAREAGPPDLLSVAQASRRLSIGRSALYDAIGRGDLRSIKIGRRRLVPSDALAELTERTATVPTVTALEGSSDAVSTPRRRSA